MFNSCNDGLEPSQSVHPANLARQQHAPPHRNTNTPAIPVAIATITAIPITAALFFPPVLLAPEEFSPVFVALAALLVPVVCVEMTPLVAVTASALALLALATDALDSTARTDDCSDADMGMVAGGEVMVDPPSPQSQMYPVRLNVCYQHLKGTGT